MQSIRDKFEAYLLSSGDSRITNLFCKSLYAFLFLKIAFIWPVLTRFAEQSQVITETFFTQIVHAPVAFIRFSPGVALAVVEVLLVVAAVTRLNYFSAAIICWISFSLSSISSPIANGSDQILNLLLLTGIFLSGRGQNLQPSEGSYSSIVRNFALLAGRIQLCFIYLLSGLDKISSSAWRSGDAIFSISNLEFFSGATNSSLLNPTGDLVIAWLVILFELSFPFLIWYKRLRIPLLVAGVLFHVCIIVFLNLPDFGMIMILAYIMFLPPEVINFRRGETRSVIVS